MRPFPANQPIESESPFIARHIGPDGRDTHVMLKTVGSASLDQLIDETLPASIRERLPMGVGAGLDEVEAIAKMRGYASRNRVMTSLIGQGYYGTHTPLVILRNILENPAWYTAYTPYQPEISQGRLEALLNYQTLVADLCGLDIANASLLDESTAAAEAMAWGLPGVSFDLEALKTYYPQGILKTSCFDQQKFADNILLLLTHPQTYHQYSQSAVKLITNSWSWPQQAATIYHQTFT